MQARARCAGHACDSRRAELCCALAPFCPPSCCPPCCCPAAALLLPCCCLPCCCPAAAHPAVRWPHSANPFAREGCACAWQCTRRSSTPLFPPPSLDLSSPLPDTYHSYPPSPPPICFSGHPPATSPSLPRSFPPTLPSIHLESSYSARPPMYCAHMCSCPPCARACLQVRGRAVHGGAACAVPPGQPADSGRHAGILPEAPQPCTRHA